MKLNISKYWQFLSVAYPYDWELYHEEPILCNDGWRGEKTDNIPFNINGLFDNLPITGLYGKIKLFKRDGNKWIEVPKDQWKTDEEA